MLHMCSDISLFKPSVCHHIPSMNHHKFLHLLLIFILNLLNYNKMVSFRNVRNVDFVMKLLNKEKSVGTSKLSFKSLRK